MDNEPTGTYLDSIVFTEMVRYQTKHPSKYKEVSEYILESVKRDNVDKNCATLTLDSLVERDILDKEQKMLGLTKKYPTLKFGMYVFGLITTFLTIKLQCTLLYYLLCIILDLCTVVPFLDDGNG